MATADAAAVRATDPHSVEQRRRLRRAGVGAGRHAQAEPRSHHLDEPTSGEKLATILYGKTAGRTPTAAEREVAGSALHYAFGAAVGAAYAMMADRWPLVTVGRGSLYGAAVWLVADELGMPAAGLAPRPDQSSAAAHGYALLGHLAYGTVLDAVRRVVA